MVMLPPQTYRKAYLRGFWLTTSASVGVVVGVLISILASPLWSGLGAAVAIFIAAPGLLWPQATSTLYKAWNRLARYFDTSARLALSGISFYVILVAVGKMGGSLKLAPTQPRESGWVPRDTLAPDRYLSQDDVSGNVNFNRSWIRQYISWAVKSGNFWTISLLPFLILLAALDTDTKIGVSSETYTLY